jgi:hypothetical protein
MADTPSGDVVEQLQRTVDMFEAIADAQPDDFQSLEILKEAYVKLGRREDLVRVGKRLASAYRLQGEISKAIFECEGVLQESPDEPEATALLAALRQGAPLGSETVPLSANDTKPAATAATPAGAPTLPQLRQIAAAGDRALASLLIAEKIATPQAVDPLFQKLKSLREGAIDHNAPLSLIQLIVNEQFAKLDDLMTTLLDKSNLPYLPLSVYDVDRDAACLLPVEVCWQFCLVPFDRISRSTLVATANPFDETARHIVSAMLNRNVFWYVSTPLEIAAAMRRARGLDGGKPPKAAGK